MTRIRWGEALRAVFVPALLIGPLVGAIGACGLFLYFALLAFMEGADVTEGLLATVSKGTLIGVVLGLAIASPTCLLFALIGVRVGRAHVFWRSYRAWSLVGACVGAVTGLIYAVSVPLELGGLIYSLLFFGSLGLIGAAFCRWMLRKKFASFSAE